MTTMTMTTKCTPFSRLRRSFGALPLALVLLLLLVLCFLPVASAAWFGSETEHNNDNKDQQPPSPQKLLLSSLVSPLINRELETSVVAHAWPSNPQSVFCEAYAFHTTNHNNKNNNDGDDGDNGDNKDSTTDDAFLEDSAAIAKATFHLNQLANRLLEQEYGVSFDTYQLAKEFVLQLDNNNNNDDDDDDETNNPKNLDTRLLEFALHMRAYSPQCELHRQLARQTLLALDVPPASFGQRQAFAVVYPGGSLVLEEDLLTTNWTSFAHTLTTDADDVVYDAQKTGGELLLPGEVPLGGRTIQGEFGGGGGGILDDEDDESTTTTTPSSSTQQWVILYANLGTTAFAKAYHKLLQDARRANSNLRFVVRHLGAVDFEEAGENAQTHTKPLVLQGYGVRLDIRNVEYKVFDDRKDTPTSGNDGKGDSSANDGGLLNITLLAEGDNLPVPSQFLAGVNLTALGFDTTTLMRNTGKKDDDDNTTNNNLLQELWKRHQSQLDHSQLIPPTWQRRKLPLQAAAAIAQSKDPLVALEEISLNLPSVASTLVHAKIPEQIQVMAEALEEDQFQMSMPAAAGALFINGRFVKVDRPTFNVFELLNTLRKEQALLEGIQTELGPHLKNPTALQKVQRAWMMGEGFLQSKKDDNDDTDDKMESGASKVYRIDVGRGWKQAVMYVNDIEKDAKYAQWPRQVRQIFMAMQFGMPPSIRRNLFTALAVIDPVNNPDNVGIELAKQLMQSNYPIRLGVLLVGDEDVQACKAWVAANPEGEGCPVIKGPILKHSGSAKEKDKLKDVPATARAVHKLFSHVLKTYPGDATEAYLDYFFKMLSRDKQEGSLTMFQVVQNHIETMEGMQLGRSTKLWTEALELLTEDDDDDDGTAPSYHRALRFAVDKGVGSGMSFINGRPLPMGIPSDIFEETGKIFNEEMGNVFRYDPKRENHGRCPKIYLRSVPDGEECPQEDAPATRGLKR